jgi:MFS transporter, FLVCR family, MFS-domain-containing protein 7
MDEKGEPHDNRKYVELVEIKNLKQPTMENNDAKRSADTTKSLVEAHHKGDPESSAQGEPTLAPTSQPAQPSIPSQPQQFKVYKRRWFGLFQLSLLNIIVSWDVCFILCDTRFPSVRYDRHPSLTDLPPQWLTFSAVSATSADYFGVSEDAVNWLSTGFLFAFCVVAP